MAWRGDAWLDGVRFGTAVRAGLGMAGYGMARLDSYGSERLGGVGRGMVWPGSYDMAGRGWAR